jgi:hypothetical protein
MLHANIYIEMCTIWKFDNFFNFLVGGFLRKINIQLWHLLLNPCLLSMPHRFCNDSEKALATSMLSPQKD